MRQQPLNTSDKHWKVTGGGWGRGWGADSVLGCCETCTEVRQKDRADEAETERGWGLGVEGVNGKERDKESEIMSERLNDGTRQTVLCCVWLWM